MNIMFQAVSDSDLTQDDVSTTYETDCDVEVCSDNFQNINELELEKPTESNSFEDIDTLKITKKSSQEFKTNSKLTTTQLTLWWPSAAQKVLNGLYSTKESKNTAVSTLMNLFEYKYTDVESLKLPTQPLIDLRNLYNLKLQLIEKYATEVKNNWCDVLRTCAAQCKVLLKEKETTTYYLRKKAIHLTSTSKNTVIRNIIKEEYDRSIKEIEYVFICRMKLAKTNYKLYDHVQDMCKLYDINNQINKSVEDLIQEYDHSIFLDLEHAFEKECANIDFRISKQLQRECEEYWMEALQ